MNIPLSLRSRSATNFFLKIIQSGQEMSLFSSNDLDADLARKACVTLLAASTEIKVKDLIIILLSLEWDSTTKRIFRKHGLIRNQKSLMALCRLELSLWILRNIFVSTSKKVKRVKINFLMEGTQSLLECRGVRD